MSERTRFFELLPFEANGTASVDDAAWLRSYAALHPELAAQPAFVQALRTELKATVDAALRDVPANVGYAVVAARLAAECAGKTGNAPAAQRASPWQRLAAWLGGPSRSSGWNLACGLALGLMVGVGTMLVMPPQGAPTVDVRGAAPGLADGPLLRVSFRPEATESAMRLALIEARVLVVAGPTRLGDYYLKAPAERLAAARELLLRSGVLQRADEVPGLPPDLLE